jgi:DNA-binding winged helix-turn-helix (wHTH) protein/tetratricopeptide (TPR) repeat protein
MLFAFGEFELDVAFCELRRTGARIQLQPKVLDTLRYLIEHRDHVVSKQELLDALWDGQQLNDIAVPWSVSHARRALQQRRSDKQPIETVRGRGYRFVTPVRVVVDSAAAQTNGSHARLGAESVRPSRGEPFVGRGEIMAQLTGALTAARSGSGSLWLLTGEAGIGKTRCATEFARMVRRSGLSVWTGRCVEAGGGPAFWPWIQILRESSADASLGDSERAEVDLLLRRLVPTELDLADVPRPAMLAPSDASRFWLLERLCRCLRKTAEKRARLVVLDDLHCADDGSLEALALLSTELLQSKMLVVGTARDPVVADADGSEKSLTGRLRRCVRVALSGLGPTEIESYMLEVTGRTGTPELTRAVHSKTAGNPLFLREAVSLVSAHQSRGGDIRPEDVKLPEVAKGFLRDRLAILDEPTREILDAACVIGEEFDMLVLTRATGLAPDQLLAGLDGAVRARFLSRHPDTGRYGFVHGLIREILHDALSNARRVGLHEKIALALESLAAVEPRLNELAFHFHHALPAHYEQALHYSRLAGNASMQVFAHREAAQFYAWALAAQRCAPLADARTTCELLLASAIALRRPGRVGESLEQCRRALALARREGFADLLVEAAQLMRPTVSMAPLPDPLVLEALEHALQLLPSEATAARAQTYGQLACIPPYSNDVQRSQELSERAVFLARETGRTDLLLEALSSRFHGLSGPDTIDELLGVSDEVLRLDAASRSWWSADAFYARYHALLQRGDMVAAQRALEAFGQTARVLRVGEAVWQYERLRAQQRFQAGELERAAVRFHELARESRELCLGYGPFFYGSQLNELSRERTGRLLARMFDHTDAAWKLVEIVPSYQAERISYLIEVASLDEARVAFSALAQNDFAGVTGNGSYLFTLSKLAMAAPLLANKEAASALYDRLRAYPHYNPANGLTFCLGSVSYFLGVLARFLGRPAPAEAHFEEALVMNERIGYEPQLLRTQLALAGMLARTPSRARRERAAELVSNVRARAAELGMSALQSEAEGFDQTNAIELRPSVNARAGRS